MGGGDGSFEDTVEVEAAWSCLEQLLTGNRKSVSASRGVGGQDAVRGLSCFHRQPSLSPPGWTGTSLEAAVGNNQREG